MFQVSILALLGNHTLVTIHKAEGRVGFAGFWGQRVFDVERPAKRRANPE